MGHNTVGYGYWWWRPRVVWTSRPEVTSPEPRSRLCPLTQGTLVCVRVNAKSLAPPSCRFGKQVSWWWSLTAVYDRENALQAMRLLCNKFVDPWRWGVGGGWGCERSSCPPPPSPSPNPYAIVLPMGIILPS